MPPHHLLIPIELTRNLGELMASRRTRWFAGLAAVLVVAACGDLPPAPVPPAPPPAPVASVTVFPNAPSMVVGTALQLSAITRDALGNTLAGRAVAWRSSAEAVATVNATGLVTGVSAGGPVTITATSEGQPGTAQVIVTAPPPVASVTVSPGRPNIFVGTVVLLSATTTDAQGNTLSGRAISWSSSAEAVATVDATGLVTGVSAGGPVAITATSEGQTGTAQVRVTAPPLPLSFATIAGGLEHTCGLTAAGVAWCWGSNGGFRLGTAAGAPSGATNLPVLVDGGMTFSKIYSGGEYTCALSAAGSAFCWGKNDEGQLGTGNITTSSAPTAVTGGFTFSTLTTGFWHTCGLSAGGIARCWGGNYNHSVGDESFTNRSTPTLVAGGISFTAISAGDEHTCALSQAAVAWCWGWNEHGELGDGTLTNRSAPVPVLGGHVFESIVAGGWRTCARKANGEVWCWGYGESGALGDGAFLNRSTPVLVTGGNAFVSVTAGAENTCGLLESGLLKCWGFNDFGGVGDGTRTNRSTPVSVSGGHVFLMIAASFGYHTCGLKAGGVPWCWGWNEGGQLGDGSFVDRVVPTPVRAPALVGVASANALTPSGLRESPPRNRGGTPERGARPPGNRPGLRP